MKVLIVGRTKMSGTSRCIGGLLKDGTSIRLMKPGGQWDTSSQLDIGDIWKVKYTTAASLAAPHTEDVLVTGLEYVEEQIGLSAEILTRIEPWRGDINDIFEGKLGYTNSNNGFMSHARGVTDYSTWFWISDKDLTLRDDGKHYDYPGEYSKKGMSYVGEDNAIPVIPAGTLLRLSLARWWKPHDVDDLEERCYLQLSGWF